MLTLAALAIAILGYTYFGYPIVILLLARVFPRAASGDDPAWTPMVSALIPIHDAAQYVDKKLESLLALDWPADRLEILVYSDGSTDETEALVERWAARDARVRLLRGELRSGKPTAVNRMLKEARGEVLLMTDVRQPLDRRCLRELVGKLAPEQVACVSGNLVLPISKGAGVYWRYENALRDAEARFRSMLGVTGPIYVIRARDLPELPSDTILDDMWIPLRLRLAGRILDFARAAIAHDQAFDDEREFGRKVRTLAGQYQLLARLPALCSPMHNPSWFEFVSHKLLRLVCPWALLVLFLLLPFGWASDKAPAWAAASVLQLGFYGLALAGSGAGKLGQVARTFVVLNAAAVVGLWRQVRGAQRVTW